MSVLVVGGGIAGQAVVEAIRERDRDTPITLACAEPRLPYDRVALSTLLTTGADPDTLTLRPALLVRGPAGRGPPRTRAIERARPGYDRYVLCTGSRRARPADPGRRSTRHVFRGPEDCAAIVDAARDGRARS